MSTQLQKAENLIGNVQKKSFSIEQPFYLLPDEIPHVVIALRHF